jgi:hypothetical protein
MLDLTIYTVPKVSFVLLARYGRNGCHGMMIIPYLDVENFERWVFDTTQEELNIHDHFPLFKKIYDNENYDGPESGALCSFTTIAPGAAVGKGPYWTITDAYKHVIEVSYICKYIHRHEVKDA